MTIPFQITGGTMQKFERAYKQYVGFLHVRVKMLTLRCRLALTSIAEGGTLAEEVISTVRTAQAFGTQRILASLYDVQVEISHGAELKASFIHGIGIGIFFFVIYSGVCYAYIVSRREALTSFFQHTPSPSRSAVP